MTKFLLTTMFVGVLAILAGCGGADGLEDFDVGTPILGTCEPGETVDCQCESDEVLPGVCTEDGSHCTCKPADISFVCDSTVQCDDENPCTLDGCNDKGQCEHWTRTCSDGNPMTLDSCELETGECLHEEENLSVSPVPVSDGIEIRLVFDCTDKTGYEYRPRLHLLKGTDEDTIETFHAKVDTENDTVLVETNLYKDSVKFDPKVHGNGVCDPGSGTNTYPKEIVTDPATYLVTLQQGASLESPSTVTPRVYFYPDVNMTVELWNKGNLVVRQPVNLTSFNLISGAAVDLFNLTVTEKEVSIESLAPESQTPWCAYLSGNGCADVTAPAN